MKYKLIDFVSKPVGIGLMEPIFWYRQWIYNLQYSNDEL